jgi:endoglucanase
VTPDLRVGAAFVAAAVALLCTPAQAAAPTSGVDGGTAVRVTRGRAPDLVIRRQRPALVTTAPTTAPQTSTGPRGLPLRAVPGTQAATAAARLRADRPADAALLDRIAATPQGVWLGDWTPASTVGTTIRTALAPATTQGALVTFVLYAIPHRDCHAGGLPSSDAYRAWIDAVAAGLAGSPALVVLEPDALAMEGCLGATGASERNQLLRYAVGRLATGSTWTYLDAGHAGWLSSSEAAARLAAAGVNRARGFSLNVSNFGTTADQSAYAHRVADKLGRPTPYVVDVGRNGLGPWSGPLDWCNPPGRALGANPTTTPPDLMADALLWVKPPGESDGRCRPGEPSAGTFWVDYALGLARAAGWS